MGTSEEMGSAAALVQPRRREGGQTTHRAQVRMTEKEIIPTVPSGLDRRAADLMEEDWMPKAEALVPGTLPPCRVEEGSQKELDLWLAWT